MVSVRPATTSSETPEDRMTGVLSFDQRGLKHCASGVFSAVEVSFEALRQVLVPREGGTGVCSINSLPLLPEFRTC